MSAFHRASFFAILLARSVAACGSDDRAPLLGNDGVSASSVGRGVDVASGASVGCDGLRPFDPGDVYLLGTLSSAYGGGDGITHNYNPQVAMVGFGSNTHGGVIRERDGALLSQDFANQIYVFHEDACLSAPDSPYPAGPLANDEVIESPCGSRAQGFLLAPNDDIAFFCDDSSVQDADGQVLYSGPNRPLAYDGDQLLFTQGVFDIGQQTLRDFAGLPAGARVVAARAGSNGFRLASISPPQLWRASGQGGAELEGSYEEPADFVASEVGMRLARDGALFQKGTKTGTARSVIARLTLSGSEVVYDEAEVDELLIYANGVELVSGP
jgi:hypothetical protein